MSVFFGMLAFFGAKTVSLSGEYVTGMKGLMTSLVLASIFVLLCSLFAWVGAYIGLRVVGYFKPIVLEYVPASESQRA